jgi:cell division protein FtsW (lipid II flippase)
MSQSITTTSITITLDDHDTPPAPMLERLLLACAGGFVVVSHLAYTLAARQEITNLLHLAVWLACVVVGHLALNRRLPGRDPLVFPIVMLFCGWGLVLIDRLAPPFAIRQTVWLVVSVGAMVGVVSLPRSLRWLSRYRYLWLVGGLILLGTTIILGRNPAGFGPRLWLGVFDAYFQPSELLKLLLIVFLASYLAENRELLADERASTISRLRYLLPLLMMWGISLIVLVWQRDLGTATLFFIIFLGMLYIATGQAGYVVGGAILLLLAGGVAYFAFDVVKLRVDVWLNPWPEANDRAFQIVQSLLAFASGGVFGQGIGQGSPTYIPVVHSDFIFAAIGEEWGLLGTLCVVACIAVFSVRAFRLAARLESRPFRGLLAAGIGITLATQSLMIIGGTIKLIPLTGVTLPFLSYGGSSLLVNFIMVGLLLILSNDR